MANSKTANIHNKATKIKKTPEDIIINTIVYIICAIVFILTVYPFYYCVVISFNEGNDASLGGIFWGSIFRNASILDKNSSEREIQILLAGLY